MTDKMGAKQLRTPLLKVLGDLSGMKASQAIDHEIVYTAICKELNISIDQYGTQPGSGSPWVERWTQWAFKDLTKFNPPLTVSMGKGKWALTSQGVKKVLTQQTTSETEETEQFPVVKASGSSYHADPYIVSLAIQATKCHDAYSDQSPICATCAISGSCKNAQAAVLSDLARTFALEDVEAAAALKNDTERLAGELAALTDAELTALAIPVAKPINTVRLTGAKKVECVSESLCKKCRKKIALKEDLAWVHKPGGGSLFLHMVCFEELVAEGKADPIVSR